MENTNETVTEVTETKTEGKTFTQDEVNALVKERLDRAEKKWQEKYSNYYSADDLASKTEDLNKQITELGNSLNAANDKANADAQTIADLEAKASKYETDSVKIRIALENGIPFELANKLTGTTEEEIRNDAKKMSQFVASTPAMPMRNPEADAEIDGVTAAFKKLNPNLF